MKKFLFLMLLVGLSIFVSDSVFAAPPFTNLEGVGGVALNPLAYLADSSEENSHLQIGGTDALGKARFGAWYVNLGQVDVDWTAIGVTTTLFRRLEVSYGYETINPKNAAAKHKNNFGTKLLLLSENSFDSQFVPAVSVGTIYKRTSNVAEGVDANGLDYYLVATKLITQSAWPVLFSGGVLSTQGLVTGVFGFGKERKTTFFGNIDLILPWNYIVGLEYKQGAAYSDWKDADYWNVHIAWTPNSNLTLILAYVNAGDYKTTDKVGLGGGLVLSTQYSF